MKKFHLKAPLQQDNKNEISEIENDLNTSQLEAVRTIKGPILVIAGAGSGKTRTLIYRVAHLVSKGVAPEKILLLTFTRKAAEEMMKRASTLLDFRCTKVSGGTFHSFANNILRKYAHLIGFGHNFTIVDRPDAEDIIQLIRTNFGFHKKEMRFPKKKTILDILSKSLNKNEPIKSILKKEYPHFLQNADDIELLRKSYKQFKLEKSIMDYDDLLHYLKVLLETSQEVRKHLSSQFQYIMIDEYQDTNKLQGAIACYLASEHHNIMVVGDDAQSIYSFRGANFRNIMDFPKIFPKTKIIKLEENYRSCQPILDLTNAVIERAKEKYQKKLISKKESEIKPAFIESDDENTQSQFIAQKILQMREEGTALNDIAILFRSAWHSNDLELELSKYNIPYVKHGGFKFVETAHVKDIVAHLRLAFNPLDSISWLRALLLVEGIGPQTAKSITHEIVENKKGISFLQNEIIKHKKYNESLHKLYTLLQKIEPKIMSPAEKTNLVFEYYKPLLKRNYDDANKRENDIQSLINISERFKDLEKFLVNLSLDPFDKSHDETNKKDTDKEKLILSTIHSAKGLEWKHVFIIHLVDGYIPSAYAMDSDESLEEERRLLYVAMTRAKENLFLVKPNIIYNPGNYFDPSSHSFAKISRFFENGILDTYTEKWSLAYDEEESVKEKIEDDSTILERIKGMFQ